MKKLFLLLALVVGLAVTSNAQVPKQMAVAVGDTLVNTDTLYKSFTISAGYAVVGVQIVVTKISGTVAGNVIIQKTMDGSNWQNVDTLALSNVATNSGIYEYQAPAAGKMRVQFISAGTQSYTPRIWTVFRKHD